MKLSSIEVVEDRTAGSGCEDGFLRVKRLVLRNHYADGSQSRTYPCDVVSRPGSEFEAQPGAWGAFSIACMLTLFAVLLGVHLGLRRLVNGRFAFLTAATGLVVAIEVHVLLSGPLWDRLLWPGGALRFHWTGGLVLAALLIAAMGALAGLWWWVGRSRSSTRTT